MFLVLSLTYCLSFVHAAVPSGTDPADSTIIDSVRRLDVSQLDSTLPHIPLATWLKQVVHDSTHLVWEVNDCGEQTGDPAADSVRDIPTCVSIESAVDTRGGFGILIGVGSVEGGINPQPGIYTIYVRTEIGYRSVRSLHELPAILRSARR